MNSCTFGSAFFASASCPVALSAVKARSAPVARPSPSALTILGMTCANGQPLAGPGGVEQNMGEMLGMSPIIGKCHK